MIFIKNILKISFVIIGTIIGAGFASGKEIYTFFCVYGICGLFGLIISNIIISLVIYFTFTIVSKNNIKTYSEFTRYLVGNNKVLNYSINNIMDIFLLISFIVMIAGFGAYFSQEFNLPIVLGSCLISLLAIITFFKNMNGIIRINSILIPILILLILFLGYKCEITSFNPSNIIASSGNNWLFKSVLYASYNSIVLVPIVISLNNFISNNQQIKFIILFTLIFMIIMSIVIYIVLCINMPTINFVDIPVVYIASNFRFII